MAPAILHSDLARAPWRSPQTARLPGTTPIAPEAWLTVDPLYAAQMAERARLIEAQPDDVMACLPEARAAMDELYDTVLEALARRPDFDVGEESVRRPDGVEVRRDPATKLSTLGRLTQEDFCLHLKPKGADEHVLVAAILCFPANWTLAEKIGRPLTAIHDPVPQYGGDVARRVQRLFNALRPVAAGGSILMRMNAVDHDRPDLFQTRPGARARPHGHGGGGFLRIERQTLRRLEQTGAIVFSIHTSVFDRSKICPEEAAAFGEFARTHAAEGRAIGSTSQPP